MNLLQVAISKSEGNILFLDGGFATHLESLGEIINENNPLWSAKLLLTNPSKITKAHYDYLNNGSNIIITSSYQASIKGFTSHPFNLTYQQAVDKMSQSVILASNAVKQYYTDNHHDNISNTIMIAPSIGCFGAGLNDGSEYTGYYGENVNETDLIKYHSVKMHATMKMKNKVNTSLILACETIPNLMEIKILTQLLNKYKYYGWITMAFCNEYQLNSKNEYLKQAIDIILKHNVNNYVTAIGFNCTHPKYINDLIKFTKQYLKDKDENNILIIVYPNSGEKWDGINKEWIPNTTMTDEEYGLCALEWYKSGANIIGGCCRTTPNTIKIMKETILKYVRQKHKYRSKL